MSDEPNDEVAKLRAAAAKAREEYETMSKAAGKEIVPTAAQKAAAEAANMVESKGLDSSAIKSLASDVDFTSGNAMAQSSSLDTLVSTGDFSSWKSAVRRPENSAGLSLLRPFPVTLGALESRTDGKVTGDTLGVGGEGDVTLDDFKDATIGVVLGCTLLGVLSLAFLPENVGASLTYLFAIIPVLFLGIGSTSPGIIAAGIKFFSGTSESNDDTRERICAHEAGHFLCGYLCGLPIKSYNAGDSGVPCVEFFTDATTSKGFTEDEISAITVVAMSGSVGEIIAKGKASGGENDLRELDNCFRRSEEFIGAAKQQELTRWGALKAYDLLKSNRGKYDALVKAFEQGKGVEECVTILEASP